MSSFSNYKAMSGSTRREFPGTDSGKPAATERVDIIFQLRPAQNLFHVARIDREQIGNRAEMQARFSATDEDIQLVIDFANQRDLWIDRIDAKKRLVFAHGSVRDVEHAFKVSLRLKRKDGHTYRIRFGAICLPEILHDVVVGVFGMDERPQARAHIERCRVHRNSRHKPNAFDAKRLAEIYDFPRADGEGQTVAIIELGGGFFMPDLVVFFNAVGLPVPDIHIVSVDGGKNRPFLDEGADGEVALDIQVCGAAAPKAKQVIYFAPNTDSGFLQAILAAIHDEKHKPSVISISWGLSESGWTEQMMTAMNTAFEAAAALGISVFAAAGDDGVRDSETDGLPHVDFPASSPGVTGCGGTTLLYGEGIRRERVWNAGVNSAGGGGISGFFDRPPYQKAISMQNAPGTDKPGRGVPDVSAVADPNTGYAIFVRGSWNIFGGTSAVAPLMAGLVCRINQLLQGQIGFLNRFAYRAGAEKCFFDVVDGDNSSENVPGYFASAGWDAASGFGVPIGNALLKFIAEQYAAEA